MAQVGIHFSLWLSDGVLVDRTEESEVMTFEAGDGQWLPALETFVLSVPLGETSQFLIQPEQGYGFPDPTQIHWLPIEDMNGMSIEIGQIIEFDLPNGDAMAGRVLALTDDQVQIDFSHPLAGHELILEVTRVS